MRLALLIAAAVVAAELAPPAQAHVQAPDRNPVMYAPASVARGKSLYLQNCQSCHDEDGRARSAAVAIAADLTDPSRWKFGTSDAQLFKTIKNGAAEAMPPFGVDLKDEQIWDVVNFIRSIGPAANRPPLR
ncbi:MAG TPA: c-type cytochrome [Vicinamibacterales bacterium]|jgi:mono/diheme cytochrome c family protein